MTDKLEMEVNELKNNQVSAEEVKISWNEFRVIIRGNIEQVKGRCLQHVIDNVSADVSDEEIEALQKSVKAEIDKAFLELAIDGLPKQLYWITQSLLNSAHT